MERDYTIWKHKMMTDIRINLPMGVGYCRFALFDPD